MNYPGGPDEPWDDTTCANCGCDLPDKDPDPENSGTSPWWDGFCSEPCRKGEPVPPDEDQLKSLNAYGHITYGVGDGDWLACFDFRVWKHPSRGVLVAYEVVVDTGHTVDSPDSGVVEADKAPFNLPDYWTGIGMDDGTPWTEQECKEANECQARWAKNLKEEITQAQGGE